MGLKALLKARKAYQLQGNKEFEQAGRLYEEAVAAGLDQPRYLLAYTILLIREQGQYAKARDMLVSMQKLPTLTPDQKTELFVNYSACVYKMGELEKGVRLLERQHQHQPQGILYQTLGYLYVEKYAPEHTPDFQAQAAEAAEAARKAEEERLVQAAQTADGEHAAEKDPDAPALPTAESLRAEWEAGIEKALAFEQEAIDYDDEDAVCLDNMGQFLYRVKGDTAGARPWFDRALAEKEGQIDTLWFLSRYDLEAGDTAAAIARLEKALEGRFSPLNYADRAMVEAELARLRG